MTTATAVSVAPVSEACKTMPLTSKEDPSSTNWFAEMPSFHTFKDITKDKYYRKAPDDWHVVITDVKGSTKAIEEGRYKDVNTIGAASISTVQNLLSPTVFPFVFGGDGATLLVSPADIDRVLEALLKLQVMAEQNFQLGLRVGHISVGEVHAENHKSIVEVAKHELAAGKCTAVFRGGGLTVAEAKIKGQEDKYCVQPTPAMVLATLELTGLTCHWNPVPSKRGKIMSLLVAARDCDGCLETEIYNQVLKELDVIYLGHLEEANPVNTDLITYQTKDDNLKQTKRFLLNPQPDQLKKRFDFVRYACDIFFRPSQMPAWARKYRDSMRPHADHRKFDDMLRMIMDCSLEQANQIETLLEQMRVDGKIHYGIFLSDTALMTCYVEDVADGQHIHFVDGGNGGYAMAAKQLKAQLKGIDF